MFEVKAFNALNTTADELKAMYNFKVQSSKEQDISFSQSFEDWKAELLNNYKSQKETLSHKLLLKNGKIVGSIGFYFLHRGKKEELQIVFLYVLNKVRDSYWRDFNMEHTLALWTNEYRKTKFETSDALLIKNLLKFGFKKGNVKICMDLNVINFNWEKLSAILNKEVLIENKLKDETITNPNDHEIVEIAALTTTLLNDMKRVNTNHQFLESADTLRTGITLAHNRGQDFYWMVLKDENQKMIGMSWLKHNKENPKILWQYMSGVLPQYRNIGLTKWMKATNYKKLTIKFPSIQVIKTDSYIGNDPMIHINEKMGFKTTKVVTELYYTNEVE